MQWGQLNALKESDVLKLYVKFILTHMKQFSLFVNLFAMNDQELVLLNRDRDYIIQTCFNFQTEYIFIQNLNLDVYLQACKYYFRKNKIWL